MGVASLIRSALHPGTTLKHEHHKIMPVDALHALARAPRASSVLIHARFGQENLEQLRAVVLQIAMEVFAHRDWQIPQRRQFSRERTLGFFVEQVWHEYLGEPCRRCKGYGYIGRKFDTVRHSLGSCQNCRGMGFVMMQSPRPAIKLRSPCPTCRGKGLVEISEEVKARRLRPCAECWGSGAMPASVRARAKALRLSRMEAWRVWQERFRVVLAELRAKEHDGLIICREFLFGN